MTNDRRLPSGIRSTVELRPAEVLLSPVSLWEAMLLAKRGKIDLGVAPAETLRMVLSESEFIEAPLTHEIAILSRELELPHEDPADRFLAATAVAYGVPLATVDKRLTGISWLKTVSS